MSAKTENLFLVYYIYIHTQMHVCVYVMLFLYTFILLRACVCVYSKIY